MKQKGEHAVTEGGKGGFADAKEEISFLRQKFNSLTIRGHYKECFKLIEDNLKLLYFKERWPENFCASLLLHKRCYPSMDISKPYDEYLAGLLAKNGIPAIFTELSKGGGKNVDWKAETFKELAIQKQSEGEYADALGYADLMIKMDPLSSNAHLLRGWMLQHLERGDAAIEAFERALELNKTNFQANASLAESYAAKDPAKALEFINEAIEHSPGEPAFQAAKARILLASGDREGALAAYDEANQLDPLNPEYIYQKGEAILQEEGQELAAIRQFAKVLSVDENHLPALTRLSRLTAETQPETALGYATKVAAAKPQDRNASLLRAALLDKTGDFTAAIRQYKATLELDPDCAIALGGLGKLYLPTLPQIALEYFNQAVEKAPGVSEYQLGKADAHYRMGDTEAAIAGYKQVLTQDKRCAGAYAALAALHRESDSKAAVGYYNKALLIDPENAGYYRAKGEILLPTDRKQAVTCFSNASKYDPGDADLHLLLGRLLEEDGSRASAAEHYRSAVSLVATLEEAHFGLARLLCESEPATALASINKAISLSGGRAEYYYYKSIIYIALGKDPEATRELKGQLSMDESNEDALQELAQLLDGDTPRVAMMYINRALETAPDHPTYLCTRASLLEALGDRRNALEQYAKAIEADESFAPAQYGVGKLLASQYDATALDYLDKAIALDPANGRYHAEKALLLAQDPQRYAQALTCMDEAIAKDNQMWDVILAKAELLEEHGEVFPALESYRRVLLVDRDNLEANIRRGVLLTDYNPRAALTYLDHAIALDPQTFSHHVWRAKTLHRLGDEAGAMAAVQTAVELGGQTEEVYYTLAKSLYQSIPERSLEYCRMALELAPHKAQYPLLAGNIYRRLERTGEARAQFEQALELDPACHEALARIAELQYKARDAAALETIDRAIAVNSGNASYRYLRALILEEGEGGLPDAIAELHQAMELAPGNLGYREKYVELLGRSGAGFMQKFMEKRKLDKLRRSLEQAEAKAKADE